MSSKSRRTVKQTYKGCTFVILAILNQSCPAVGRDGADLVPATYVETEEINDRIVSLLDTYRIFSDSAYATQPTQGAVSEVNFFFSSGANHIVDQRVSRKALPIFSDSAVSKLTKLPTHSDVCYVQDFVIASGVTITTIVHNEDNNNSEDVFRCFTAGLVHYSRETLAGIDVLEWRQAYQSLLTKELRNE